MANEHIQVEDKRKVKPQEKQYVVFWTDKENVRHQSDFYHTRQRASDFVYALIQGGDSNIIVFQEVPYRIQI